MKTIMVLLTAVMLVLAGSTAWALPTINIFDLGDGAPTVTTSDFVVLPGFDNPTVTTAPEFANISGTLFGTSLPSATFGLRMLEPVAGEGIPVDGVSDFATLSIFSVLIGQGFNLSFVSDGAQNITIPGLGTFSTFNAALAAYNTAVNNGQIFELEGAVFPEDGTLQNLVTGDALIINAQSDVEAQSDVPAIPLPSTVFLFGTGLLGLGALGRRFRKA